MAAGIVKWFDESNGLGSISREFREDVLVHDGAISGRGGARVEFGLTRGLRRAPAARVRGVS